MEGEGDEAEGRGAGLSHGGRNQLPQFSWGWRSVSERVFAAAKNEAESGICAYAEVPVLERFCNPSVTWNGQFQICCCPRSLFMQGLCRE